MKKLVLDIEGINQKQWTNFVLELNLMKKAWRPYGVDVELKAKRIKSIIELGTRNAETIRRNRKTNEHTFNNGALAERTQR